jgi:excisionase family DNA binding protein
MDGAAHVEPSMHIEPSSISHDKIAFTVKEAARASGLSRSLLYVAIGRGSLRARKCGRRTVVLARDLSAWIERLPTIEVKASNQQVSARQAVAT